MKTFEQFINESEKTNTYKIEPKEFSYDTHKSDLIKAFKKAGFKVDTANQGIQITYGDGERDQIDKIITKYKA